jgi:hypothetical protein
MAKIITATIDPATGEVETELNGYQGKGCHAIQDVITKALGGEVTVERRKPEFNKAQTSNVCVTK